jgi:hypothetical protein
MEKYREFTDEEKKWINKLKRLMNKAPNVFLYVANGTMYILPERYITESGGIDCKAPCKRILTSCEVDGGGW